MKEFKGVLGNYKIIKTDDNTETIWSEYFDENCHNLSGAREETIYNYIQGCEIAESIRTHSPLNIFDVGFGPGLGLLYLSEFLKVYPDKTVNYYSIELDPTLVLWAIENTFHKINHTERNYDNDLRVIEFEINNIKVKIFIGDGRSTIPRAYNLNLIGPLHAIFQDPFSPKKNPTLWTVEWFTLLKKLSHPNVKMATYSSSISIRKSMIEAGFFIKNERGFGKKRTMTKANLETPTDINLLQELEKSPIGSLHDNIEIDCII